MLLIASCFHIHRLLTLTCLHTYPLTRKAFLAGLLFDSLPSRHSTERTTNKSSHLFYSTFPRRWRTLMPTSLTSHNSLVAHSRSSSSSKSRRRRRRRRFRFSAAACGAPPRTPPPTPPPPPPPLPTTPPSPCRSRPPPTSTRSSARCPSPRRSRAEDRSGDRGQCHVFGHSFSFDLSALRLLWPTEHVLLLTRW